MPGQDSHSGRADLIRHVAIGGYTVATYDHGLHPAFPHDDRGHIIANQRHVHAGPA